MITIRQKGNYSKLTSFLERIRQLVHRGILNKYGEEGVALLSAYTPKDTGTTADSWSYEIQNGFGKAKIIFHNSNFNGDFPVAIALQYGHGTNHGGYVEGRDYINPAIQPLFDKITDDAWKEITRA